MRDTSHERNGNGDSPNGRNHDKINGESGRSSKAKTHPARTSMNEMKRRVAAILEFVGKLQTQRNNASGGSSGKGNSNSGGGTPDANGNSANGVELAVAGLVKAVQAVQEETENVIANGEGSSSEDGAEQRIAKLNLREDGDFRTMASQEMMETLTRELVGWQRVYGFYSR